jgi:hypothetical protein
VSRYRRDSVAQLDASRRVGWARYYTEAEHCRQVECLNAIYRDRVEVAVSVLLGIVDAVLHERNAEAFARAWQLQSLVDAFVNGRPRT